MTRILARWSELAALATALSFVVYITAQQIGRENANDPQIQMARDARDKLVAGASATSIIPADSIDISTRLAPWVQVLNDSGRVVASSMRLHGKVQSVPSGVLYNVRASGEDAVTWMPEPG